MIKKGPLERIMKYSVGFLDKTVAVIIKIRFDFWILIYANNNKHVYIRFIFSYL